MAQKIIDKEILNTFPADSKSQDLNGLHWEVTDWSIGDPISEEKMDNTEQGLIIAFYKLNAILKEIGGALGPDTASDIQLNSSKIDALLNEVGGTLSGTTINNSRLDALESVDTVQNNKIEALEAKSSAIAMEIWSTDTVAGTSRLDRTENKIAAIANELGGGTPDGNSTTYPTAATRLDDLEKEIGGTRSSGAGYSNSRIDDLEKELGGTRLEGSGYTNSRLDNIEEHDNIVDKAIAAVKAELGGTYVENSGFTNSRVDINEANISNLQTKASALATELFNSDTTSGTSRIDLNENKIKAIAAELGGGTPDGSSASYPTAATRLDDLEKEIGGTRSNGNGYNNSRIDTLESVSSTHTNELTAIKNELGGTISGDTYEGITRLDSVIDKVKSVAIEIWGSDTVVGNSRLDSIENHNSDVDKAIIAIKNEIGGTYVENEGFTNSRIDAIEQLNTEQNEKISALAINLYGADTTIGNSRLDALNEEMYGASTTRSRLDDIELIIGGTRNLDTGGYDNNNLLKLRNRAETLENIVGAPETISDITHESRLNKLESDIKTISTLSAPPIVCVTSINEEASDEIVIETNILDNGIGFIFLNKATLGEQFITVRFDGYSHSIYLNGATRLKAKLNQSYLLGVYRNGDNLYIFNAPAVI